MAEIDKDIETIESVIRELSTSGSDINKGRRIIRESLLRLARIPPDSSLTLADTFEKISNSCGNSAKKDIGIVTIRLVCCTDLLPAATFDKASRHIVQLIEDGCPDCS